MYAPSGGGNASASTGSATTQCARRTSRENDALRLAGLDELGHVLEPGAAVYVIERRGRHRETQSPPAEGDPDRPQHAARKGRQRWRNTERSNSSIAS